MSFIKETEAVAQRFSVKKFLEILQNPQEKTCATVSFFNETSVLRPAILLKNKLWYRYFPVIFSNFLRTPFLTEHLRWFLL